MINFAVVGAGIMGQNHARVLAEMGNLVAVCDSNPVTAVKVAERYNVKVYDDYKKMVNRSDIDAVVIATPTETHKDIALDFIKSGKHVLVEKPLSFDIKSAIAIMDAAKKAGTVLTVGHIENFNPIVSFLKREVDNGVYGNLLSVSTKRVSSYPGRITDVGVVFDLATHDIDVIRYITQKKILMVSAIGGGVMGKREDYVNILLALQDDISATIETNWLTPVKIRRATFTFEKKYVELDYMSQSMDVLSSQLINFSPEQSYNLQQEHELRRVTMKRQEPLKLELSNFIGAIEGKNKLLVTGEDGLETIKVAVAVLNSLKNKMMVEV
jgi:UDP-N-acetylglucosamine 3-dehydrogenase